ncbi:MAG: MFS transporter [Actinomycetaceae bacterium]|nr:MFS transporter [Actinomycetaceae bacterium]
MNTHAPGTPMYLDKATENFLRIIAIGVISVVAFEAIAVGTAMPTVALSLEGQHLYAIAMGVPLAAQLITTAFAGLWCDAKSARSCLYLGLSILAVGLVACALAPGMAVFVAGRAVQGLGAGMCVVPLYAMVGSNVSPARQPSFFAAMAAAWILPSLIGPGIAGFLVEYTSWRLVFGFVPAALLAFLPVLVCGLRRIPPAHESGPLTGMRKVFLPATIGGIAVAMLQVLSGTRKENFTALTYAEIFVAIVVTFVCLRPLLPRGTFVSRKGLASAVLVRGIVNGTCMGVEAFLPLLLQEVHGWSPTPAGFILTVGSVTWALGSWIQGKVADSRRRLPVSATVIQLVGLALVVPSAFSSVSPWLTVVGWSFAGLGAGLIFPAMSVLALSMTPRAQHGATSSAIQLSDTLGAAFCVAIAGIVFALAQPGQEVAFASTLGVLTCLAVLAVVVSRRVQPRPGSVEEREMLSRSVASEAVEGERVGQASLPLDASPSVNRIPAAELASV